MVLLRSTGDGSVFLWVVHKHVSQMVLAQLVMALLALAVLNWLLVLDWLRWWWHCCLLLYSTGCWFLIGSTGCSLLRSAGDGSVAKVWPIVQGL